MNKILIVFGTRPEAIKLAPLIHELKKSKKNIIKVCSTGQHNEMLKHVISLFKIKVDISLKLMKHDQKLTNLFTSLVEKMNFVIQKEKPKLVIVQGDTTTALAASMSAFFSKIKIAHIEAGLRTNNIQAPWPEEANRKIISSIADFNFTPTNYSKNNLIKEGISTSKIFLTGNTVVDALNKISKKINSNKKIMQNLESKYPFLNYKKKIILITLHRREIFGDKLKLILKSFKKLAIKYKDLIFVYPVHLNPNVKKFVFKELESCKNFILLPPIDYFSLIYIMQKSYLIMSDSGGIQEEAPSFHVPIIILRDVTERQELINSNQGVLAGTNEKKIIKIFDELVNNKKKYKNLKNKKNPFGDGKASKKIRVFLEKLL